MPDIELKVKPPLTSRSLLTSGLTGLISLTFPTVSRAVLVLALCLLAAACVATPTPPPSVHILNADQTFHEILTETDPVHQWQFVGKAGEGVRISTSADESAALVVDLRSPDGVLVAGTTAGSAVGTALPMDGVYLLTISKPRRSPDAAYSLRLTFLDRATPTLTPTFTVTPAPSRTPTFTHTPTDTLTPSLTPTDTRTPTLTWTPSPVYAPLGALVGSLTSDQAVDGSFLSAFDRQVYQFAGATGQYASLLMTAPAGSPVDPRITLYDPAGAALATDDDSGGGQDALILSVHLPVGGIYFVQVTGGESGAYLIKLAITDEPVVDVVRQSAAPGGTATPVAIGSNVHLPPDTLITGQVAPGRLFDRYFINAEAGDVLTIRAQTTQGSLLRLALELYTPAGELMTHIESVGGATLIPGVGVIETGTYALFVTDSGQSGGGYTLSFHFDSRAETPTPLPRTILSATDPFPPRTYLYYPFQGTAGARIHLRVEALDGDLDPVAALIDPSGTVIAEGDDSAGTMNPDFEASLPADGTYILRVNGYGETSGSARVSVEALP